MTRGILRDVKKRCPMMFEFLRKSLGMSWSRFQTTSLLEILETLLESPFQVDRKALPVPTICVQAEPTWFFYMTLAVFSTVFQRFFHKIPGIFWGFWHSVSIVSPCFPHKGHELSRLPRQDTVAPRTPLEKKLLVAFCQVQMAGSWLGKIAGNSWSSRSVKTNW